MYKNKSKDGLNNVSGKQIQKYRKQLSGKVSQNDFAVMLQNNGLDLDKNAIQRSESGKRFVTDIELKIIAKVLKVDYSDLLDDGF